MVSYIFPADPLGGRSWTVDSHFEQEYTHAARLTSVALLDSYSFGDRVRLQIPEGFSSPVVYRGWMLSTDEYRELYAAIEARGCTMLTDPESYIQAHSMDGWIDRFRVLTPPTRVLPATVSEDELLKAASSLHSEDGFFLKGTVKSEPGFSRAQTAEELPGLLERFRDFSAIEDSGKIALRSFIPLNGTVAELRTWWIDGHLSLIDSHPNFTGRNLEDPLDGESLEHSARDFTAKLAPKIWELSNRFLTADIALTEDGDWILVELGDGQVSGFPESYSPDELGYCYERFEGEFAEMAKARQD